MQRKKPTGPPQQHPDLGGAMVPITVYLPPDVLEWAKRNRRGAGEVVRRAVLKEYRRATR